MDSTEIEKRVRDALGECDVHLEMDGNKAGLLVTATAFEGLSRLKRQQKIYAALGLSEKAPHLRTQPINSSNLAILFCSWNIWNVLASGSKAITISLSRLSRQTPTSSL